MIKCSVMLRDHRRGKMSLFSGVVVCGSLGAFTEQLQYRGDCGRRNVRCKGRLGEVRWTEYREAWK